MSRKDGMRNCYQTATFYLFIPGRWGRSARVLEDSFGIRQMASSNLGGTELHHALRLHSRQPGSTTGYKGHWAGGTYT